MFSASPNLNCKLFASFASASSSLLPPLEQYFVSSPFQPVTKLLLFQLKHLGKYSLFDFCHLMVSICIHETEWDIFLFLQVNSNQATGVEWNSSFISTSHFLSAMTIRWPVVHFAVLSWGYQAVQTHAEQIPLRIVCSCILFRTDDNDDFTQNLPW